MMETKRLILRPVQLSDAEDIFDYATDEDTGPRAGWKAHENIEGTRSLIKMWLGGEKEKHFAVIYKEDNKVVGTMGVTLKDIEGKRAWFDKNKSNATYE